MQYSLKNLSSLDKTTQKAKSSVKQKNTKKKTNPNKNSK